QGRRLKDSAMTVSATAKRREAARLVPAKGVFIDNEWQPCESGGTIDVFAPADGRSFAQIAAGNAADVDKAVKAARRAYETGAWGRLTAVERGRLLSRLGEAVLDAAEDLTQLDARATGNPMTQALSLCASTYS